MGLRTLAEFARGISCLIYPNACLSCGRDECDGNAFRHGLCCNCEREMRADPFESCARCAATVGPHTDTSQGCPACRDRGFRIDLAFRLGPYEGRLKGAILRMKSSAGEPLAEMLGRVLADRFAAELRAVGPVAVVPIPLHWRSRWRRGYNQAESLARELAAALQVPCRANWLRRVKPTAQHTQPSASARRENIRGAFRCARNTSWAGRTVLLVDDVMTTGSTLGEAARVIREATAAAVAAVVLARA